MELASYFLIICSYKIVQIETLLRDFFFSCTSSLNILPFTCKFFMTWFCCKKRVVRALCNLFNHSENGWKFSRCLFFMVQGTRDIKIELGCK